MKVDLADTEESSGEDYLTESQKRSLTSSLYLFEKALRKAAQLLLEEDVDGIFFSRKSRLSPTKRQYIQKKIFQTLKELANFANQLGLNSTEESVENEIMADMSISWENLEECRSKRLKGYGELDPLVAQLVDPAIDHFARIALELSSLIIENTQEKREEDMQQ
ncbi:MAG TPA: hypothetical protein PKD55_24735 [Bellilinea sp.]|nr:hypothetical protein [Bellilinea sp.]